MEETVRSSRPTDIDGVTSVILLVIHIDSISLKSNYRDYFGLILVLYEYLKDNLLRDCYCFFLPIRCAYVYLQLIHLQLYISNVGFY